jgi:hypothetical protein
MDGRDIGGEMGKETEGNKNRERDRREETGGRDIGKETEGNRQK